MRITTLILQIDMGANASPFSDFCNKYITTDKIVRAAHTSKIIYQFMSIPNQQQLTVTEAQTILNQFNCIDTAPQITEVEQKLLRQAVLLLAAHSDYQILGICADTTAQALLALTTYTQVLGYEVENNLQQIDGAVYIKFNGKNGKYYLDSYTGKHRGVLVSYQSYFEDRINAMYGHLPLDLFISNP